MNGSFYVAGRGLGWALLVLLSLIMPAFAQEKPGTKPNCYAYRVDNQKNRVYFNDPQIYVVIPPKEERERLRQQGALGQVFMMQNCDTPDLAATVDVYLEPQTGDSKSEPTAKIISGMPVYILAEQSEWCRVKGRVDLWRGEGWVKVTGKTILVKY